LIGRVWIGALATAFPPFVRISRSLFPLDKGHSFPFTRLSAVPAFAADFFDSAEYLASFSPFLVVLRSFSREYLLSTSKNDHRWCHPLLCVSHTVDCPLPRDSNSSSISPSCFSSLLLQQPHFFFSDQRFIPRP